MHKIPVFKLQVNFNQRHSNVFFDGFSSSIMCSPEEIHTILSSVLSSDFSGLHLSKNLSMNQLGEKLEDIFDIDSSLIILKNVSTNKSKSIDRNKFREIDSESINTIINEII